MHEIYFYRDKKGNQPVLEYILQLTQKKDKDSRIKLNKIQDYIGVLKNYGVAEGEPYVKYLGDDIWELRPLRDRIFFAAWVDGSYVLLHHFMKKTQRTPTKEIEQAKRELADLRGRGFHDGQ